MHHHVYVVEENESGKPKRDGVCRRVPKVEIFKWRRAGYVSVSDHEGEKRMAKQRAETGPEEDPDPDPDKIAA